MSLSLLEKDKKKNGLLMKIDRDAFSAGIDKIIW